MLPPGGEQLIRADCLFGIAQWRNPEGPGPPLLDVRAGDDEPSQHEHEEDEDEAQGVSQNHSPAQCSDGAKHPTCHLLNYEK